MNAPLYRFIAPFLAAILLPLAAAASPAADPRAGETPAADEWQGGNVRAELVAAVDQVVPGETFLVGLRQQIRPGWHTYWRNPGDSGAATEIHWQLPPGFEAGAIQWPAPERIPYGPLVNFGYEGEILLPVAMTAPAGLEADNVTLAARAEWLVCADICIPEDAELELQLPVGEVSGRSDAADLFDRTAQDIPRPLDIEATQAAEGETLWLNLPLPDLRSDRIRSVTFFPFAEGAIDNAAEQPFELTDDGLRLRLAAGYDYEPGQSLNGVVVVEEDAGEALITAFEISPQVSVAGPGVAAGGGGLTLAGAFLFAFLGGLILNLMPCVFPVLSIKILSLVGQAGGDRAEVRLHGWVYAIGVVLSFIAIAIVLIALRAGGAQIGWGFQLQSPLVVALLAYLFFIIGLWFFGLIEGGTSVMNLGQGLMQRQGLSGSFFTGVLATVVAAPCTVPFMASAVGFALTQGNLVALTIFAALGLGMATPYVLLCHVPGALNRLPRPGPWMVRFREFLAFPMFASAIWLIWVLSQQSGPAGVLAVLSGMLIITFVVWLSARRPARSWARYLVTGSAVALAIFAIGLPLTLERPSVGTAAGTTSTPSGYEGPAWEAYSPERLEARRAEGPVFVNFTAAWCITCKVNEAVALDSSRIKAAFADRSVSYLKGDWTNEDPVITAALEDYGRSGVPLYLLYVPGEGRAKVLPQVLTESLVLGVLEDLP